MPIMFIFLSTEHDTDGGSRSKYRPAFLDHFEAKEREQEKQSKNQAAGANVQAPPSKQATPPQQGFPVGQQPNQVPAQQIAGIGLQRISRSFLDGDFEFVSMTYLCVGI